MRIRFLLGFSILMTFTANAQYKNDNVKYHTVFLDDLCKTLLENPGYVLLDVRSKGEFSDTSTSSGYNMGHLKNAININIDDLPQRLNELKGDKGKPIFVYCSHSQRSRRASALLADSGFAKVFNINGGMTTLNLLNESLVPCSVSLYETKNKYKLLSPQEFITAFENNKNAFILDIRKDSVFREISSSEKLNSYGRLKNAVNIPLDSLPIFLQRLPRNGQIIVVDDYGAESPKAAHFLADKGFINVSILFDGLDNWVGTSANELQGKDDYWIHPSRYKLISSDEFDKLASMRKDLVILDVRLVEEFNNRSKSSWRNRGNLKNAINIPSQDFKSRINEVGKYKDRPILIYSFSSSPESFETAKLLADAGFKDLYVLMGGIWDLKWRAANIKGKSYLNQWVENIPSDNL